MKIRKAALAAVMGAVVLGTTHATVAVAAQAPASLGLSATNCGEAVRNTRADLQKAGAPTNATDWQSVRNAAQNYLNSHPWNGPGTQALHQDVNDLNRLCAP
ncbi:hypothetical protein [Streptomyces sp. NPDC001828]|uniref:hypothetical protein n=1 Tax=Streptomyces sp. NPDC001828 TaxID=3364615 RepID=UPI0036CFBBBF